MARRVLLGELSGVWVLGRPWFGWCEGVENPCAHQIIEFHTVIFLVPLFSWTALPCSGGISPSVGWDAVTYIAVGVNCKKDTTTEYQGAGAQYMCKGVYV